MLEEGKAPGSRSQLAGVAAGSRRCAMRVVQEDPQHIFVVYELMPAGATGTMASEPPTLVFEADGWHGRLREYPADWRRMSDTQLVALLHRVRAD